MKIYFHSIQFIQLLLRIINLLFSSHSLPSNAAAPNLIDNNEGRSIHYYISFLLIYHHILSIIVDNDSPNAFVPNSISFSFGRSIHSLYHSFHCNTSNNERTPKEIHWWISNYSYFDWFQIIQISQFKFTSEISKTTLTYFDHF